MMAESKGMLKGCLKNIMEKRLPQAQRLDDKERIEMLTANAKKLKTLIGD